MRQIILASASPRRKELLQILGLKFRVVKSNVDEKLNPRLGPQSQAEDLSRQKAEVVAAKFSDAIVIGADTIVVVRGEIFGKPKNLEGAKHMLSKLSGQEQEVITGFTLIDTAKSRIITKSITTKLLMRKLTSGEIEKYVQREQVMDKSGSYAITGIGAIFFEKIAGDYYNVVGLPLFALSKELKKLGVKIL